MPGYVPSLAVAGQSGNLPAAQPTVSNEDHNSALTAKTPTRVVHEAVAVIVGALVILLIGRGYLRNARIA